MAKVVRDKRSWAVMLGLAVLAGLVAPLMVMGSGPEQFTATPYADVIRFEAHGVASLRVEIFDLSGRRLWDSGVVLGRVVDWNRTNMWGERLAYGTYLYQAQGWNAQGKLIFQKSGKLALLPGDKVQLQQAPAPETPASPGTPPLERAPTLQPLSFNTTNWYVQNTLGVGTFTPARQVHLQGNNAVFRMDRDVNSASFLLVRTALGNFSAIWKTFVVGVWADGVNSGQFGIEDLGTAVGGVGTRRFTIDTNGRVGIGPSTNPAAALDIQNSANQPALRLEASAGTNLIEAYNTGSGSATGLIFRVERATGNVRADGAFYGAGFYTGSADVAEHINVSEQVEPGDVVEIDPNNPLHFRKAQSPYSRLVAGVISTNPGVVLGSNSDPVEGEGDPRPMLALAGRVPVKVTTEDGPIAVGDLLVSSSRPGYAMKLVDPARGIGAVIGKALEPLTDGEGVVMVQVTLR